MKQIYIDQLKAGAAWKEGEKWPCNNNWGCSDCIFRIKDKCESKTIEEKRAWAIKKLAKLEQKASRNVEPPAFDPATHDWAGKPMLMWLRDGEDEQWRIHLVAGYNPNINLPFFINKGFSFRFARPVTLAEFKAMIWECQNGDK